MKRTLTLLFVFSGLAGMVFAAVYVLFFWQKPSAGFPVLAAGSYIGVIDGAIKNEDGSSLHLYADSRQGDAAYSLIAVLAQGWKPQIVNYAKDQSQIHAPVELTGPAGKTVLTGRRGGTQNYNGEIEELGSGKKATWRLLDLTEIPSLNAGTSSEELRELLSMKGAIREVNEQIRANELTVTQQKTEIAKLEHYITEGGALKRNADKKFKDARDKLYVLEEDIAKKKREADGLVQKLELSQRLTGMGKLVSLSRKSMERENRWVDSMLKTSLSDTSLDLEDQVVRGEAILRIKGEIAQEQDKLFRLMRNTNGKEP